MQRAQFAQPLQAVFDGLEVGQRPAQPALVHVELAGLLGGGLHRVARLALGAYEDHAAAVLDDVHQDGIRFVDRPHRMLQVDDVDAVASSKDEAAHLRVPALRLVPEVHPGTEQLAHL